jgi:hypothetical protein
MTAAEEQVELARRAAMLGATGYAATQIVAAGDWRAGIQELLSRLGLATGVSRVTLFEVHMGPEGRLAVIEAVRREGGGAGLAEFEDLGVHVLRGREGRVRLWGCAAERPAQREILTARGEPADADLRQQTASRKSFR